MSEPVHLRIEEGKSVKLISGHMDVFELITYAEKLAEYYDSKSK